MRDDQREFVGRTLQELRRPANGPRHGQAVEAIAADACLACASDAGTGYRMAASGNVAWKAVSKAATCGRLGEARPSGTDGLGGEGIVQRRQVAQRLDRLDRRVVEEGRCREPLAAVDHAIADGVDRAVGEQPVDHRRDRLRRAIRGPRLGPVDPGPPIRRRHDRRLERGRARVQDEDAHGQVVSASSASR